MMGIKRNFLLLIQISLKENCYPKYVHFIQIQIFKQLFLENNLFIFNIGQWPHIFKGKFFTGVPLHFCLISISFDTHDLFPASQNSDLMEGLSECLCTFWNLKKSENLEKGLRKLLCFCQSMW